MSSRVGRKHHVKHVMACPHHLSHMMRSVAGAVDAFITDHVHLFIGLNDAVTEDGEEHKLEFVAAPLSECARSLTAC